MHIYSVFVVWSCVDPPETLLSSWLLLTWPVVMFPSQGDQDTGPGQPVPAQLR